MVLALKIKQRPREAVAGADAGVAPSRAGQGLIEIRNFRLSYETDRDTIEAVSNVDLTVRPGEFVSVIGPSGCGKSTMLNAVAGFVSCTSGHVRVDGEEVVGPGADRGVVFQQYSIFPWMTVLKNVEFGLKMQGLEPVERARTAHGLLKSAGLSAFADFYPDRLSGGMKQRVGIVRALATRPKVLLLDEPFGALDAQTRAIMQQILINLWQQLHISVLFVTHDIDEAIFLSDRVYVMTARPGTIKAELAVDLERPRKAAMVTSPAFLDLRRELNALIREESLRAMGAEITDGSLDEPDEETH